MMKRGVYQLYIHIYMQNEKECERWKVVMHDYLNVMFCGSNKLEKEVLHQELDQRKTKGRLHALVELKLLGL